MFSQDTHILVVDDSSNIRQILVASLEKIGFSKIETAVDATSGFEKLVKKLSDGNPFTLIFSDLNMPGPSGLDFLKKIRSSDEYKSLPFILVTTESEKGAVLEAAMAGVSSYVVKPFDIDTISKKLLEAWNKHGSKLS